MTEKYRANKRLKEQNERKKREEERQTNTVQDRKLAFLTNIIYSSGLDMKKVAAKIGTTQQALSWCFSVKDDCRLSQAEQFLNVIGYSLKVEIINQKTTVKKTQRPINEGENQGVRFRIEGDFEDVLRWNGRSRPNYLEKCTPNTRMYWLAQYILQLNEPITELMSQCEIDLSSLRYIFTKDDIKISQIFQIARTTKGQINWKVNKIQK